MPQSKNEVHTVAHQLDNIELNISPVASSESMTGLERVLSAAQTTLRASLVVYAICISGIFALFANRRAEGSLPLSVLFIASSLFYNVFGALMFGKRVGNFLSDSYKRGWEQKDLIYLAFWFTSLGLAGMTAMAGVKVSEDSVQVLHHDALIKAAVGMFVFNTLSTRWAGGLDMMEKIYKEIRYNGFDRFFQDWKKYNGAELTKGFVLKNEVSQFEHQQLIEHFYTQLAEKKLSLSVGQELTFYSDKIVKTTQGFLSLLLFAMWISLTAKGLRAIDPEWEKSAPFTISCASSNLPFYFMSCFNLYPNAKSLMTLIAEKFDSENSCVRNTVLGVGFVVFLALAIVSGGGFGEEVKGMVEKGYGNTTHDIIPDAYFTLTNSFASYFAMVIAGLVNFANTTKFFADVLSVQKDNPHASFGRAMGAYMNFVEIPPALMEATDSMQTVATPRESVAIVVGGDGVSSEQLQAYTEDQKNQLVKEMQSALSKNQFAVDDRSALSVGENAIKVTADVINAGRSQWHAATSWCASWFGNRPQTNTALEEPFVLSQS